MQKWKKWKIKFKVYSKSNLLNFNQYKIREETKYRFCLYFIFYNFYKNYIIKMLFYNFKINDFKIIKNEYLFKWKVITLLIHKLKNYLLNVTNPTNKFVNIYRRNKQINVEYWIPEIFYLVFLKNWQLIKLNINFLNINYIYSIKTIFELILWIHIVKINIFLLNKNDNYFYTWTLIYNHQQNCLNVNYFYNSYIFKQSLERIFYYLKILIKNYIF